MATTTNSTPVIAIFDVGKTNKKLFLFDEQYKLVFEKTARFTETHDEDGDPCENLESLRLSVFDSLREVLRHKEFDIRAINFSTYGASFVYIDNDGHPLTPLYNYLKEYPAALKQRFYDTYGDELVIARETASPVLGSLNSGMQLYRLRHEQPKVYKQMKYALHLPQYMSYLLSGTVTSDITSIGCHTQLWNFNRKSYHSWVRKEGLIKKLAPLEPGNTVVPGAFSNSYSVGIGLHDSSAALIPYLVSFHEPFVLLSTGTWCISLNPFNNTPLTTAELKQDCLSYMTYQGKPVKASRLFAGHEHELQVKRIADHFNQSAVRYRSMPFNARLAEKLCKRSRNEVKTYYSEGLRVSPFGRRDLSTFASDTEAYHQLILDLVRAQHEATGLVLIGTRPKRLFVDGGFSKNVIYMNLLAAHFPDMEVYAASMAQATAIGTALAIHDAWNEEPLPNDIIELKYYAVRQNISVA